jgi:uncharacterized protein (DUF924 family)
MDKDAEEILDFWLNEVGEDGWYTADAALDTRIRERWLPLWERGREGELTAWTATPRGTLALLILLDQFPRNMFRGEARAFASDARALTVAMTAILRGFDKRVPLPERQFFYLPLMHSEVQTNQDKSVRLHLLSFGRGELLRHARAHRDIIRTFGRFPYRNAALGRETSDEEQAFLDRGGYVAALNATAP